MSLSGQQRPLPELEDAHEHADILLTEYRGMVSDQLAALLSSLRDDLMAIIEDNYGIKPEGDTGQDAETE